ncbi:MAG: hypothetical protein KY457_11345 [Actinobacteria bacterium]|nr:hypothetical protein [Actinomycetota bacterium]
MRLFGLVLPAMLAVALLLPAAASAAPLSDAAADAVVVLAAEEGGAEGPQGPEPGDPNDTENPAAPADYEAPFLWAASVGLLALALLGTLTLVGLYYLLVVRPRQKTSDRS